MHIEKIDKACFNNGINANSTVEDVEEVWVDSILLWGIVDKSTSDEEREKMAKAFADYMAYKRTQF